VAQGQHTVDQARLEHILADFCLTVGISVHAVVGQHDPDGAAVAELVGEVLQPFIVNLLILRLKYDSSNLIQLRSKSPQLFPAR